MPYVKRPDFPESTNIQLGNNKAITRVAKAEYSMSGRAEPVHVKPKGQESSFLTLTLREETANLEKFVGEKMKMVNDTVFVVELWEDNKSADVPKVLRASFTFRDDQVQIWVTFFREVSRVRISKFYSQSEKAATKRDVVFTFTLPNAADVSATQAKSFFAKLQYACEVLLALDSRSIAELTLGQRMSLVKLAYSNVDREAIVPAAQGNFHHMTTKTKASSMLPLIDEGDEHPDDAEQPDPSTVATAAAPAANTHLRIVLDGIASRDDDWIFTGAWNEPGLVAMIEKFGIGWDRNGVSQPSAIKKKRKSKRKLTEEQKWEKEQVEAHRETNCKTKNVSHRKRSLSPGHSPEHDDGRKRPSSRPRGEPV